MNQTQAMAFNTSVVWTIDLSPLTSFGFEMTGRRFEATRKRFEMTERVISTRRGEIYGANASDDVQYERGLDDRSLTAHFVRVRDDGEKVRDDGVKGRVLAVGESIAIPRARWLRVNPPFSLTKRKLYFTAKNT